MTEAEYEKQIQELEEIIREYQAGYKGACYCCEPVAELNEQLRIENRELLNKIDMLETRIFHLQGPDW